VTGRRILLTGASGCIGHYLSEALIQRTNDELFLIIRDPKKFKVLINSRANIHIVQADLRDVESLRSLLATIHCAILVATGWGDVELDVIKTLELLQALDPQVCQQVIYFSTASLLGRDKTVLPEALSLGTDYIRAKAQCYEKLVAMDLGFPVLTVFPTLVVGGDRSKPYSHLSSGLPDVLRWAWLLRFFKLEGSCHFIHAQDIATVVLQLIQHPEQAPSQKLVLGNAAITANEAIAALCKAAHQRIYVQLDLTPRLANWIIRLFKIQMGDWDYFCLNYRHFQYANPVSPKTFGLPSAYPTLSDILNQ
jgi:nucleoside-diphosphate-sugar epimerase